MCTNNNNNNNEGPVKEAAVVVYCLYNDDNCHSHSARRTVAMHAWSKGNGKGSKPPQPVVVISILLCALMKNMGVLFTRLKFIFYLA